MFVNGIPYREWLALSHPGPSFPWAPCPTCGAGMNAGASACMGPARHPGPAATVRFYATLTGTKRNLTEMHAHGMRLVMGPDQLDRQVRTPPLPWFVDNGAWSCFRQQLPFDADAFRAALDRWGPGSDFVVAPDVVAGGLESLAFSRSWERECRQRSKSAVYLVVQDGMSVEDVAAEPYWFDGLFVGGSTAWKERTMHAWGALAQERGLPLHVGRVNSDRRLRLAIDAGASSVDGTSPSRFSVNTARLARVAQEPRHPPLFPAMDTEEAGEDR